MADQTDYLHGREVLITGGTGSLGKELVKQLICDHKPRGIRIFSRDEAKQWGFKRELNSIYTNAPVAFCGGDIRDLQRLQRAMEGVDVCIHAAALKHVPFCELNPLEAVKTNVHGAENVMNAALDCLVEKVMYTNTDKAVKATTLYGATKMVAEKLLIDGNVYAGNRGTKFSACRYGNVLGSRGSVAHIFKDQAERGIPLSITSKNMTRFWISIPTVAKFILDRLGDMQGGEVFVPKMKSLGIFQMAVIMANGLAPGKTWVNGKDFQTTGIRQGEKLHESLFCEEEYATELKEYYIVKPQRDPNVAMGMGQGTWELRSDRNPNGELTREELLAMLNETDL